MNSFAEYFRILFSDHARNVKRFASFMNQKALVDHWLHLVNKGTKSVLNITNHIDCIRTHNSVQHSCSGKSHCEYNIELIDRNLINLSSTQTQNAFGELVVTPPGIIT